MNTGSKDASLRVDLRSARQQVGGDAIKDLSQVLAEYSSRQLGMPQTFKA